MAKTQTAIEWSQGNRDLLIELKTQSTQLKEGIGELRSDIKEIKDGVKTDIEFLKADKISRAESTRLQVESQTNYNDHETRLRFIERYMWAGLAVVSAATFLLNYFHPFAR